MRGCIVLSLPTDEDAAVSVTHRRAGAEDGEAREEVAAAATDTTPTVHAPAASNATAPNVAVEEASQEPAVEQQQKRDETDINRYITQKAEMAATKKRAEMQKINEIIAAKAAARELKKKREAEERQRQTELEIQAVNERLKQRASSPLK